MQGVPIRCFKVYLNVLACVCDLKDKDKIDKNYAFHCLKMSRPLLHILLR